MNDADMIDYHAFETMHSSRLVEAWCRRLTGATSPQQLTGD
jgi:hypothetical protein